MANAPRILDFASDFPRLADVCAKITDICVIPVVVLSQTADTDEMTEATIAFECAKHNTLQFRKFDGNSAKAYAKACAESDGLNAAPILVVRNHQNAEERSALFLAYSSIEKTLENVATLALVELGGVSRTTFPSDIPDEFSRRINESELAERAEKAFCDARKKRLIRYLLMPIIIPYRIVYRLFVSVWSFVMLPKSIWDAYDRERSQDDAEESRSGLATLLRIAALKLFLFPLMVIVMIIAGTINRITYIFTEPVEIWKLYQTRG